MIPVEPIIRFVRLNFALSLAYRERNLHQLVIMTEASTWRKQYRQYLEERGLRPRTVKSWSQAMGSDERDFYASYPSLAALEQDILRVHFLEVKDIVLNDPVYAEYGARERVLAVFYTWLESLRDYRSFLRVAHKETALWRQADIWQGVKPEFLKWVDEIIEMGLDDRQIADRFVLPKWYNSVLWTQALAILGFWLSDSSAEFARTDALVERSVSFLFDLIEPNALDSGIDLVNFFLKR